MDELLELELEELELELEELELLDELLSSGGVVSPPQAEIAAAKQVTTPNFTPCLATLSILIVMFVPNGEFYSPRLRMRSDANAPPAETSKRCLKNEVGGKDCVAPPIWRREGKPEP